MILNNQKTINLKKIFRCKVTAKNTSEQKGIEKNRNNKDMKKIITESTWTSGIGRSF